MSKQENRITVSQHAPSSNLAIADQWANFRDQFRALSEEAKRLKFGVGWFGKMGEELCGKHRPAWGQPTIWEQGGIIDVESEPPTGEFVARFKSLATRAALALGIPDGTAPVHHWFENVRRNTSDWFEDVCLGSAAFCSYLERQALEAEGRAPAKIRSRRGPQVDMDRHNAIAKIVRPYGDKWKKHLDDIVASLDQLKIETSSHWWKLPNTAKTWTRALLNYRDRVIKAIKYSLTTAQQ